MKKYLVVIKNEPNLSPTQAQLKIKKSKMEYCDEITIKKTENLKFFIDSIKSLITNFSYMLIFISFGILIGGYYSLTLHLNQIIDEYYIVLYR